MNNRGPKGGPGGPKPSAPRQQGGRAQAPRQQQPKPQPHPEPRMQQPRPQPKPQPRPEPRPQPRRPRAPRVIPVVAPRRNAVRLLANESLYFEGKATVITNVLDACEGYFYITSRRVVMDAPRHAFNVALTDIRRCDKCTSGVELLITNREYKIVSPEYASIRTILADVLEPILYPETTVEYAEDYSTNNSYVAPTTTTKVIETTPVVEVTPVVTATPVAETVEAVDPYEEIKKLKELLDMGIISQEEFEAKKHQLLGI